MKMIELDLHPDRRRLRQFGWIALVAFGSLAAVARWRGHLGAVDFGGDPGSVSWVLFAVAAISGLFSVAWPSGNRALYTLMTLIAWPIGMVVSHAVMLVLFYLVITPLGLCFRVIGRDPLHRRPDPDASSYWVEHRPPDSLSRYFRQF